MIRSQNFIGTATSILTPYLGTVAKYFAKRYLTSYAEREIQKQLTKFVQKYFGNSLVQGLTFFIMHLVKTHWKDIYGTTSLKQIAQFLINKLITNSGKLLD